MKYATLQFQTDTRIKQKAEKVASYLGIDLSHLINAYLRELARTRVVYFNLNREQPSDYLIDIIKVAQKEKQKGACKSFTPKEALHYLDKLIASPKRK